MSFSVTHIPNIEVFAECKTLCESGHFLESQAGPICLFDNLIQVCGDHYQLMEDELEENTRYHDGVVENGDGTTSTVTVSQGLDDIIGGSFSFFVDVDGAEQKIETPILGDARLFSATSSTVSKDIQSVFVGDIDKDGDDDLVVFFGGYPKGADPDYVDISAMILLNNAISLDATPTIEHCCFDAYKPPYKGGDVFNSTDVVGGEFPHEINYEVEEELNRNDKAGRWEARGCSMNSFHQPKVNNDLERSLIMTLIRSAVSIFTPAY
jgi:hypothetical protein